MILIDDLMATGGTLAAGEALIANIPDVSVVGSVLIFEIDALKGREKLVHPVHTLIHV